MSKDIFLMDGREYDVFVTKLERSFEVADSDSTGRTKDWKMHRDVIGTFYNYTMAIEMRYFNMDDYSAFYEAISAPVTSHSFVFPYNGETISFTGYCTKGKDSFTKIAGKPKWSGLSVNFIAMEPQRKA